MAKLEDILKKLSSLPASEREALLRDLELLDQMKSAEKARLNFLDFVQQMWPAFIAGRHHKIMADAFERIANGTLKRLIINMAPRHTKSEFGSYLLPAWFMGRFPDKKVIQTSNTAELAVGFGRKVKNLIDGDDYQKIFPGTKLSSDSKAAGRWATSKMGEYFAIGVGGTVTGKGADLLIIDDPHSEQEAKLAEGNPAIYDGVYEWYTSGPRQRLQPGGAIVLIMCMTGDTDVLMHDGTQKKLRDVCPGDLVATYDNGRASVSRVNNIRSNGVDNVFTVKTQSGRVLRANEEHPFLVEINGVRKWARLRHLKKGMCLVGLKAVTDLPGRSESPISVTPVRPESVTTERTRTPHINPWASMVSGREKRAPAVNQYIARACASLAIASNTRPLSLLLSSAADVESSHVMASRLISTKPWWQSAVESAMSASSRLPLRTRARIGTENFASTIATTLARFADFCATTAISLLDTAKCQISSFALRSTYDFTADEIIEVFADGREEVFDVEIDRTENFIANGVVSHNTRWSKRDLTAQILKRAAQRDGVDDWEVIEFPAIMPSGQPLWPEFWSLSELEALKEELPISKWNAQYMQNPTAEEGALLKRDWWRRWEYDSPPRCEAIIQSWDTAFLKTQRSDYSACTTWGIFMQKDDTGEMQPNLILLDAYKEKLEFPELKKMALEKYREYEPDQLVVEKRASGAPLIFELRAMGLPVTEFVPSRGNDKIARVNAISDLFQSGFVWAPELRWADEVIEECASFPSGEHDDYVDSVSQALIRFRQGGWIRTSLDDYDDEPARPQRREPYY
jgi:predicted phage terminase large subunit-like protein